MGKKTFFLIVVLMSFSLVGIIAIQGYWIQDAVKSKQQQFKNDVKIALARTAERIQEKEESTFHSRYSSFFENNRLRTKSEIKNFLFEQIDTVGKNKFVFGSTIIEENFKIPTDFLQTDSIILKKITGRENFLRTKIIVDGTDFLPSLSSHSFSIVKRYTQLEKLQMSGLFKNHQRITPIHHRIRNSALNTVLKEEFRKRNIDLEFKYGVYQNGLATALKSGYYTINTKESHSYPLFDTSSEEDSYKLFVTFPNGRKELLSEMLQILLLSVFFIAIIIITFSSSLYQLMRQKKISQIKTDFINNMTHEFKTPIATINLALDAIKNPKIINDNEKVKSYVKMIREENKRMHGQVETVLRMSKLDKKQLDIRKEAVDAHDIITEAIAHVNLLVLDKNGTIATHFEAIATKVLGNRFHLVNVLVNVLENSLKYSEGAPRIEVFTQSSSTNFIIKIKDQGIGMGKSAQKYVFDKFYREQKGNVHNVKGHGLGLSYVKEMIDDHHGKVFVESEKGIGSTFTVKLPLI